MKQYLKLLMSREGKEVLGKKGANLWLLTIVLIATFASIAFSEGSMIYLRDKMEDPFTNWVNIAKSTDADRFAKFCSDLNDPENMKRFGYNSVQMDQTTNWNMQGVDENHQHYLSLRSFGRLHGSLIKAVLDEKNVVAKAALDTSLLDDNSLGLVITQDAMKRLGYNEDNIPSYIYHMVHIATPEDKLKADSLGVQVSETGFFTVPLPVLAVVRRLPNNVDMVSANFLFFQRENNFSTFPFDLIGHEEYQHQLHYFVSDKIDMKSFEQTVQEFVPDSLKGNLQILDDNETVNMRPWRNGSLIKIVIGDETMSHQVFLDIAKKIEREYKDSQIERIHRYEVIDCPSNKGTYISIEFGELSHIREFEQFAKEYTVQLDMAQVASKENFNAVTVMAAILSAAMVIFSIVCIIMFLVNMLQSYFQKVKRNIGTFKAFGMNAAELIYVYVIILVIIVTSAVLMALAITWGIQLLLPVVGVEKDGFNYLSLWNATTYIAAAVVFVSTIATVCIVMIRMLSQTPGDLIYDRN